MSADSPLLRFQLWRANLPPALRVLLTVNLATFAAYIVLALLAAFGVPLLAAVEWLMLPASWETALLRPWTPLTYGFVNAYGGFLGLISFFFGFYWLQWMGRDYEEAYGAHRLFGLYVMGAVGAAVFTLGFGALLGLVLPTVPLRPAFGLWTPVTAILCAVATLHPNRGVGLFLLGIVPMKWIAIGFVVLSFAFSQGDFTVLGAALVGYLVGRAQQAGRDPAAWAAPLFGGRIGRRPKRGPRREPVTASRSGRSRSSRSSSKTVGREAPALDVDQILDKILDKGYESLTKEEREALDRASRD